MDMTWVTDRIAVGGGIWTDIKMMEVAEEGVTHVINMQLEFDDRHLGVPHDINILWNPTDDDFQFKPAELFHRGVEFALAALEHPKSRIFIHCAAGVHRAPMMTLAILRATGWELRQAQKLIQKKRPVVDFADIYVESVEAFIRGYAPELASAE